MNTCRAFKISERPHPIASRIHNDIAVHFYLPRFADQFRTRPDVVYDRAPLEVRVYQPWGMAAERGRWTGSWTANDGKIRISGSYFAKWRRINGRWLVESETYVPERCTGGAYCRSTP